MTKKQIAFIKVQRTFRESGSDYDGDKNPAMDGSGALAWNESESKGTGTESFYSLVLNSNALNIGEMWDTWDLDAGTPAQLAENAARNDFKRKLDFIIENYNDKQLLDNGSPSPETLLVNYAEPFWEGDFPDDMDNLTAVAVGGYTGDYGQVPSLNDTWHEQVAGPLVKNLLEDIKVLAENSWYTDATATAAFSTMIGVCGEYLSLLGGFGFTTKLDIAKANPDATKIGPVPTDAAFSPGTKTNSTHYITTSQIPLRYSPTHDESATNWNDPNFRYVYNGGAHDDQKFSKNNEFVKAVLPQGAGIVIAEIVDSSTGVWVGFVFDETDTAIFNFETAKKYIERSRYSGYITSMADNTFNAWLALKLTGAGALGQPYTAPNKILYTRPEYIRKINDSTPDPLISAPVDISSGDPMAQAMKDISDNLRPGLKGFDPKSDDSSWLYLFPDEVTLAYYNFIEHNQAKDGESYSVNQLNLQPEMLAKHRTRYSEGYFYFVLGEVHRPPGISEADKEQISASTINEAKQKAWGSLLRYFNKEQGNSAQAGLLSNLKENYFVPLTYRLNTNSTAPNNQKVLFAIRASYIDSLPNSRKPYSENFNASDNVEKEFIGGRNYAVTMYAHEVAKICADLKDKLLEVKKDLFSSSDGDGVLIEIAPEEEWNIDIISDYLKASDSGSGAAGSGDFPTLLADLLSRQAYPRSTKHDFIADLMNEAAAQITSSDSNSTIKPKHLIQIGIRDNGKIGSEVREAISYVLFSPDPESLKGESSQHFKLFYFDPFVTEQEISNGVRRSAVPLTIGLNNFRKNFEGAYGSMVLHFILSYSAIIETQKVIKKRGTGNTKLWSTFLMKYSAPPLAIYPDKPASTPADEDEKDDTLEEILAKLAKSSPVHGRRERDLYKKLQQPKYKQQFYEKYKAATPATDPEVSKKNLEQKSKELENLSGKATSENGGVPSELIFLYDGLMNSLDMEAIIALIMACIESKLGIPLTAEAICRSAILKVIETVGVSAAQTVLLENAGQDPETYKELLEADTDILDAAPANVSNVFSKAPIATYMAMDPNADPAVVGIIKGLELGGTTVNLIPAERPAELIDSIPGLSFNFPDAPENINESIIGTVYGANVQVNPFYTWPEIEAQREYYLSLGYTKVQARAKLVQDGFLKPDEKQYGSVLSGEALDPVIGLLDNAAASLYNTPGVDSSLIRNTGATLQDAQNYLNYLESIISLQQICELLVGNLLEGLEDLLKDPAGFLSGGAGNWFDNFIEDLKRKFSFPEPTFRFPDNLKTDTHMGDYGRQLLENVLTLIVTILAQVLNLVIKEALQKCIEESDSDLGPATDPTPSGKPPLKIPNINNLLNQTPSIAGNLAGPIAVPLVEDLLDGLQLGQICALLKGEASRQTLYNLQQRIIAQEDKLIDQYILYLRLKDFSFEEAKIAARKIVQSSLRSMPQIENMFRKIGESADFEICNFLSPTQTILDDVCTAFYDVEGKTAELQEAGLTEQEAKDQINQDLNSLTSKIMGFVPSLLPNGTGVSEVLNAVPDICESGLFQVPPGVQNAMKLITDNILLNVKGSLIQDMTALKFFATPPRALMVSDDPEKLKDAHSMFRDAAARPYQKECVAFIGNPELFSETIDYVSAYPLVYGVAGLGFSYKKDTGIIEKEEEKETLRQHYDDLGIQYRLDHDFFRPTSFVPMLKNLDSNDQDEKVYKFFNGSQKREILDSLLLAAAGSAAQGEEDSVKRRRLTKSLENLYAQDVKPKYLAETVMEAKHLQAPIFNGMQPDVEMVNNLPFIRTYDYPLLARRPLPESDLNPMFVLTKPFSPHTKLRDIWGPVAGSSNLAPDEGVAPWRLMLNYFLFGQARYAGEEFGPEWTGGPTKAAPPNDAPEGWTKDRELHFQDPLRFKAEVSGNTVPLIINSQSEWIEKGVVNKDILEDEKNTSTWQKKFVDGSDAFTGNNDKIEPILTNIDNIPGYSHMLDPIRLAWMADQDVNNDLMWGQGFNDLTLGEAIGFTDERVKNLFPNFPGNGAASIFLAVIPPISGDHPDVEFSFVPAYATFKQTYVDPSSPLAADPDDMIDYFSANSAPVNEELYNYLSNNQYFPQLLGYSDGPTVSPTTDHINTFLDLSSYRNYNPNILRYDLPFTEISSLLTNATTGNPDSSPQDIFQIFTPSGMEQSDRVQRVLDNLQIENRQHSLIYQNTIGSSQSDALSVIDAFRDTYRAAKGKLSQSDESNIPPQSLLSGQGVLDGLFDISSKNKAGEDIQNLVSSLYDGINLPMLQAKDKYQEISSYFNINNIRNEVDEGEGSRQSKPGLNTIDPMNFKAQIFGRLLTKKFFDKLDQYSEFQNDEAAEQRQYIEGQLEALLSSHGFGSLQYAYSNQIFSKLKRSRLLERKFMKKLWNKILVNTLGSNSGVHPECRDLYDQLNLQTNQDANNTETDFFRVDDVKQEILSYYKKSLCRDVYEKNSADENAVKVALTHGVVKLLVKVYCLEMCIASVISWDSFDLGDIFDTDIVTNIIISNISTDGTLENSNMSLSKLEMYANEIVRRDNSLQDDEELATFLNEKSALGYMIAAAGVKITSIVTSLFQGINYQPISADLNLDILKNSDPNFVNEYKNKILYDYNNNSIPEDLHPEKYKKLFDQGGIEYVLDARFRQNIYTMNYGSGDPQDLIAGAIDGSVPYDGFDVNQVIPSLNNTPDLCHKYINLYGYNKRDSVIKNKKSKNFFHSVPYNFYQAAGETNGESDWNPDNLSLVGDGLSEKINNHVGDFSRTLLDKADYYSPPGVPEGSSYDYKLIQYAYRALGNYAPSSSYYGLNDKIHEDAFYNEEYAKFIKMNSLARKHLGGSDAYNKEMYQHTQYGNMFNGTFGNITFEPYVKIEDYTEEDLASEEYLSQFGLTYFLEKEDSVPQLEPCQNPFQVYSIKIADLDLEDFMSELNRYRQELNIHNSYIFDCVALPVWSHFYNEIFLARLNRPNNNEFKDFFKAYGLKPFFKSVKFGLRMSYSSAINGENQYSSLNAQEDSEENDFLINDYIKKTFKPGKKNYPGTTEVAAWGLKSSKTLYGQRPYYSGLEGMLELSRYKVSNEIQIPIVEIEKEIICIQNEYAFSIEGDPTNKMYSLDLLGQYDENTYQLLEGVFNVGLGSTNSATNSLPATEESDLGSAETSEDLPLGDAGVNKVIQADDAEAAAEEEYQAMLEEAELAAQNLIEANVTPCNNYMEKLAEYYKEVFEAAMIVPEGSTVDGFNNTWGGDIWENIWKKYTNSDECSAGTESSNQIFCSVNYDGNRSGAWQQQGVWGDMQRSWVDPYNVNQFANRVALIDKFLQSGARENNKVLTDKQKDMQKKHPDYLNNEQVWELLGDQENDIYATILPGHNYPGYCSSDTVRNQSFRWHRLGLASLFPNFGDTLYDTIPHPDGGDQNHPDLAGRYESDGMPIKLENGYSALADGLYYKLIAWYEIRNPEASEGWNVYENNGFMKDGLDAYAGFTFTNNLIPPEPDYTFENPSVPGAIPQPPYLPTLDPTSTIVVEEFLNPDNAPAVNHLINNFHQFFYANLAQDMVDELKNTAEFKLMFDHLFPMKRYMALAFVMGSDSLSKYIPEPTDVLDITKSKIATIMNILERSTDSYASQRDPLEGFLVSQVKTAESDTAAGQPNLSKQIQMIILKTSYIILKKFVEITDPAVMIAKLVIDAANATQQAVVAGIETGLRTAKDAAQAAKQVARSAMTQVEAQIQGSLNGIQITTAVLKTIPIDQNGTKMDTLVTLDLNSEMVSEWDISANDLPDTASDFLSPEDIQTYEDIRSNINSIQELQAEYVKAQDEFNKVDAELQGALQTLEDELAEAKEVLRDIFQSPFMLPGIWASMVPSMMPYLGGIIPPFFPGGPPSTIPGMIYIALMFIDAWEEAQHQQYEDLNDVNCEDEL